MLFSLTSTTWGGKRLIYARPTGETVGGCKLQQFHAVTEQTHNVKRSTYHPAVKFVPVQKKKRRKKWQKHMSTRWVVNTLESFFILIASEMQHSAADYGELTAQLPDETLVRGNLLLHPDSAKMGHNREMLDAFSQLRSEPKHKHMSLMATHRLKCSMIFSSRTFSGKFPTHKCLVSRTILCAPAPLSCR